MLGNRKRWHEERKATETLATSEPTANPIVDPYLQARLIRVRKQLNKIDGLIESEEDPSKLDRLASAQARLSEQERQLSGRPLPGTLKPQSPKRAKSQDAQPLD